MSKAAAVEEEYEVEAIVKKRTTVEYFVKWAGYPDEENSWVPEQDLTHLDLLADFEKKEIKAEPMTTPTSRQTRSSDNNEKRRTRSDKVEPEVVVVGATNHTKTRELSFLVMFKNSETANLIPAKQAYRDFPQSVLKYYEANLSWEESDESSDDESMKDN